MAPVKLPTWQSTFCFANISLAMFCATLLYMASVLKSVNAKCLVSLNEEVECTGIMPSCSLENYLEMAEYSLFFYSFGFGFNSFFWMVFTCCRTHFRKVDQVLETDIDRSKTHLILNILGSLASLVCLALMATFATHVHSLVPSIDFRITMVDNFLEHGQHHGSFAPMNVCLDFFESATWGALSLIALVLCYISHSLIIGHILITKTGFFIHQRPHIEVNFLDVDANRTRIPSSRTYPSSPITLNPLSISPSFNKK